MAKKEEDGVWRTVGGRRIFIKDGESLTEAMKKSGKFEKSSEKIKKLSKKKLKQMQDDIVMDNHQRREHADDNPTQKSIRALNEIDQLAGDNEYLQKKGRELGLKEFKQFLKDNPGYLEKQSKDNEFRKLEQNFKEAEQEYERAQDKFEHYKWDDNNSEDKQKYKAQYQEAKEKYTKISREYGEELARRSSEAIAKTQSEEIPTRFKEGFKVQNSKYSDESKMTLVEDGSGVRLIYDGKDTGTVMKNNLSEREVMSLRDNGKIQTMSEYLDRNKIAKSSDPKTPKSRADYENSLKNIVSKGKDGTFDLSTGQPKSYNDGYQVTFSMTDMDIDDREYQKLVDKFKAHDHDTVDAGNFDGYSEISFNVTDKKKALKLAYKYNQKSVWDWQKGDEILTGGTGEYKDYKPVTTESISKSVARTRGLQNRILNYEDEIKNIRRKSNLSFTDKQKIMKLEREKEKLENQLK